jgi:hypothetical protein
VSPGRALTQGKARCPRLRIAKRLRHRVGDCPSSRTGIARIPTGHLLDVRDRASRRRCGARSRCRSRGRCTPTTCGRRGCI